MKLFFPLIVALISTLCRGGWYLWCTILAHEEGALWKFSTWLTPLWELFTHSPRIQCGQIGPIIQQDLWTWPPQAQWVHSELDYGLVSREPSLWWGGGWWWRMSWWHLASPGVSATSGLWLKCLGSSLSPWPSHSSTWPSVTLRKDRRSCRGIDLPCTATSFLLDCSHLFGQWVTKSENCSGLETERDWRFILPLVVKQCSCGLPSMFFPWDIMLSQLHLVGQALAVCPIFWSLQQEQPPSSGRWVLPPGLYGFRTPLSPWVSFCFHFRKSFWP